jgi:VanZ family protein
LSIFILSSIPGNYYPNIKFELSDKIVHFGIYSVLATSFYYSLRNQKKVSIFSEHAFLFSIVLSVLYGIIDEVHQYFVPNRTCDIFDVFANSVGALFAILSIFIYLKFRKKENFDKI